MQQAQERFSINSHIHQVNSINVNPLNKQRTTNRQRTVKHYLMVPLPDIHQWEKLVTLMFGLFFSITLLACQGVQEHPKSLDKKNSANNTGTLPNHNKGVDQIPDLSLKDANGNILQISDLKGKVVFINFWATWCAPCREEMPTINKLRAHFKDNKQIIFLMVDVDGKVDASSKYVKNKGYDLPVFKAASAIAPQYLGQAIPTTIILDKTGVIAARIEGAMDYGTQEVVEGITQLMNK